MQPTSLVTLTSRLMDSFAVANVDGKVPTRICGHPTIYWWRIPDLRTAEPRQTLPKTDVIASTGPASVEAPPLVKVVNLLPEYPPAKFSGSPRFNWDFDKLPRRPARDRRCNLQNLATDYAAVKALS